MSLKLLGAQGMELYSTVLWHTKREVDLSHLAQQAVQLDRHDPRAWIIMGNCFSLQKVHSFFTHLRTSAPVLHSLPQLIQAGIAPPSPRCWVLVRVSIQNPDEHVALE